MKDHRLRFSVFLVASITFLAANVFNWLYNLVQRGIPDTLVATAFLALAVFLLRFGYEWFYRNGYFTKKQALMFFLKCKEVAPSGFDPSKERQYSIIYRDVISDVPLRKELHMLSHYKTIYNEGRKINRR